MNYMSGKEDSWGYAYHLKCLYVYPDQKSMDLVIYFACLQNEDEQHFECYQKMWGIQNAYNADISIKFPIIIYS